MHVDLPEYDQAADVYVAVARGRAWCGQLVNMHAQATAIGQLVDMLS